MENNDTISLLKECDAGTKMAISSINEVLEKISDSNMKQLLTESINKHEHLGDEIHHLLLQHQSQEKEPSAVAKGMSWLKTNMKMSIDESDSTVADLITDGCNMGVKSLHKYLNQYKDADNTSKKICNELANIEAKLCENLSSYL